MTDYNLGTARGTIEISYKGKGPEKATRDMEGFKKSAMSSGDAITKVSRAMGGTGLILAAGLGVAAKAAMGFEKRLSGIAAVSGATAKEMDQIRDKSLQLGKDTAFSAGESAQAIEELIKAGLSVKDVLNGAADATVNLAAAGEIDMPQAATIASNAMNQFGLAAKDLPKVADNIAGAANASAIDVGEFGQSLSQVGAVANLAGLSFEDTAVAIAEMGNAGIKGSDAGTSLKSMLSRLQPTTDAAANAMKKLGILTADGTNKFYDQNGELKSLADIQELLKGSLDGMTSAQKQAALQTIFGSDAIRAAAILADNGAKGYDKMSASMGKVTAADVAAKRMDNLSGSVEQLKGSAETLGIQLGTIVLPVLKQLVDGATDLLDKFLSLSEGQQELVVTGAAAVGGLLLTMVALIKVVRFVKEARAAFAALRLAMLASGAASSAMAGFAALSAGLTGATTGATVLTRVLNILGKGIRLVAVGFRILAVAILSNPIGLIVLAIVALVAAFVILYKKNEAFRNLVNRVWAAIKSAIGSVVDWFTGTAIPAFKSAMEALGDAVSNTVDFIKSAWGILVTVISAPIKLVISIVRGFFTLMKAIVTGGIGAVKAVWEGFWGTFGGVIKAAFGLVVAIIQLHFAIIKLIIGVALLALKTVWDLFWKGLTAIVSFVFGVIKSVVTTALNVIKGVVTTVLGAVKSLFTSIWGGLVNITSTIWNAVKNAVSGPINAVRGVVSRAVGIVRSVVSSAWEGVKSATARVWNGLKTIASKGIDGVVTVAKGVKDKILSPFSGAIGWLANAGRDIMQGLLNSIEAGIKKVTDKLKSLTSKIPKVKGPERVDKKLLKPAGRWIMEGLDETLSKGAERVLRNLSELNAEIPATINPSMKGSIAAAVTVPTTDLAASAGWRLEDAYANANKKKGLQAVEGKLSIDSSGEAWIKGKAREVNQEDQEFGGVLDKMDGEPLNAY